MSQKRSFINTTIGKKVLMSVTGFMLFGFLVTHLAGNFLLLDAIGGKEAFNNYAHALISNPLIYPMEAALAAIFIIHIVSAIKVSLASKAARPEGYAERNTMGKSTFFSRSMLQTGSIIFIFLVIHLATFKFGDEYYIGDLSDQQKIELKEKGLSEAQIVEANTAFRAAHGQKEKVRDLYRTVVESFANKGYSLLYIFCMVIMGFHLAHGFQSAFQTLGLNHPKYTCCIKRISNVLCNNLCCGLQHIPNLLWFY